MKPIANLVAVLHPATDIEDTPLEFDQSIILKYKIKSSDLRCFNPTFNVPGHIQINNIPEIYFYLLCPRDHLLTSTQYFFHNFEVPKLPNAA